MGYQVGFCRTKGNFISEAIVWFERLLRRSAKYSHVYLILPDGTIFESTWPRVQLAKWNEYAKTDHEVWSIKCLDETAFGEVIEGMIQEFKGRPYGVLTIAGFAWAIVWRKILNRPIRNPVVRLANWWRKLTGKDLVPDLSVCSVLESIAIVRGVRAGAIAHLNPDAPSAKFNPFTTDPDQALERNQENPQIFTKLPA
jgi:hypothetical protein